MYTKRLLTKLLFISLYLCSYSICAQIEQYELEITERLQQFELARLHRDIDRTIALTHPSLFSLIPKQVLRDQLSTIKTTKSTANKRLGRFEVTIIDNPIETIDNVFIKIEVNYRYLSSENQEEQVSRKMLAIKQDSDLKWYFLEIGNGQEALLSAIVPSVLLR